MISGYVLCVDIRVANTAVKREHYPVPTVDEFIQELNYSCVFNKGFLATRQLLSLD